MSTTDLERITAGYGRISHGDEDQTSTARQFADQDKLADLRGWGPVVRYEDVGFSAYSGVRRPAYERLLEDVEADRVGRVLIWKIDRVARNLTEFMRFQKTCDKHGVTVASVNDPYDTSSPIGRAIVQILAVFAELESATISLRISSAKNAAAAAGKYGGGGYRRFGYTRDMTALTREAPLIRDAAERVLAGESLATLVREWNGAGVRRPNGKPWTVALLSQLLPSPHLAALRTHRGVVIGDATWPAILDRDVHEALVLRARRRSKPHPRRSYMLSGLLGCPHCGSRLVAHLAHGKRNYRCPPGPGEGCGRLSIVAEPVDAYVEAAVLSALSQPSVRSALAHPKNGNGEDRRLLDELSSKEKQLVAYAEQAGTMSPRAYAAATNALERDIADISRKVSRAAEQSRVLVVGPDPVAEWAKRDLTWKAALVAALFETPIVVRAGFGSAEDRVVLVPHT